jgi:hypothetical protein
VLLFPNGFDGPMASPSAAWLQPGGTWAYAYLGHAGVYGSLAALFWVAFFALDSNAEAQPERPGEQGDEKTTEKAKRKAKKDE